MSDFLEAASSSLTRIGPSCTLCKTGASPTAKRICVRDSPPSSAPGYRGEACQHLDLDLVDLEVKGHFRIRKVQPEVWCSRKMNMFDCVMYKFRPCC